MRFSVSDSSNTTTRSVAQDSQHLIGPMLNQLKLEGHRRSHGIGNLADLDTAALASDRAFLSKTADIAATTSKSSKSGAARRKADLALLGESIRHTSCGTARSVWLKRERPTASATGIACIKRRASRSARVMPVFWKTAAGGRVTA